MRVTRLFSLLQFDAGDEDLQALEGYEDLMTGLLQHADVLVSEPS